MIRIPRRMGRGGRVLAGLAWVVCSLVLPATRASEPARAPDRYERLEAGSRVYEKVEVVQVTPVALVVRHAGGLAQIPLADLPAELQARYGFDPAQAARHQEETRRKSSQARIERNRQVVRETATRANLADQLLPRFGTAPEILPEVDLRPQFSEFDLATKDQGRRPSCAVFAVVSALEYQNARLTGRAESLSEEYLIWATRYLLGLNDPERLRRLAAESAADDDADAGFNLLEVVQALRSYGIPLRSQMPNTFGKTMAEIAPPTPELVQQARARRQVNPYLVTGRDGATRVDNILHVLNARVPVVIGLRWPPARALWHTSLLSGQTPRADYSHAVTLVGYRRDPKDGGLVFIFRNSWGPRWGTAGHGFVSRAYLERHLLHGIFLEVLPPDPAPAAAR